MTPTPIPATLQSFHPLQETPPLPDTPLDHPEKSHIKFSEAQLRDAVRGVRDHGTIHKAALAAGEPYGTFYRKIEAARKRKITPDNVDAPPEFRTKDIPTHWQADGDLVFLSDLNNRFIFGCVSDNHLCSKYERLDVLNDLYDRFAARGIRRVYNAGNWIDGECGFNKFDLKVIGLEPQLRYFAKHFPSRPGITTYAVAGEDHEGWYSRREAIDIGRFAEHTMRAEGRRDWRHLGFMECFVPLINANSAATAQMLVMHPGGGSAYATSYRPQKIVESLEGGEKPAVLLIGHYHKLSLNLIRNVWALQIGCTQDQTPFMRKKNIDAHIGGMIVELEQDPHTGAILSCTAQIIRYFNRGYTNNRWSPSDIPELPIRGPNQGVERE